LAEEGTRFSQAISTFSATSASHMSIFTGTYPATHKVRYPTDVLPKSVATLTEQLRLEGYSTAAVTENAMIRGGSGFDRGFDSYRENKERLKRAGGIDRTFSEGLAWVREHRDERFFLFLHTYEAHTPYTPELKSLGLIPEDDLSGLSGAALGWAKERRAYAAEIHYSDRVLRDLFSKLKAEGMLDETIVIILSDHGEEFGEHGGSYHGKTVFDEILRVPLLIWAPGLIEKGRVVTEQVSLIDVSPTICDLLGLPVSKDIPGRSVVELMRGKPDPRAEDASGLVHFAEGYSKKARQVAARSSSLKWI
jgi:arylsulfatase A-like enzyme